MPDGGCNTRTTRPILELAPLKTFV